MKHAMQPLYKNLAAFGTDEYLILYSKEQNSRYNAKFVVIKEIWWVTPSQGYLASNASFTYAQQ